jgi:hypothetical protein
LNEVFVFLVCGQRRKRLEERFIDGLGRPRLSDFRKADIQLASAGRVILGSDLLHLFMCTDSLYNKWLFMVYQCAFQLKNS